MLPYGAACGNHVDLVRTLLKLGASKDAAISGAVYGRRLDLLNKLINKKMCMDMAVFSAAFSGSMDLVNRFIKEGADKTHAVKGAQESGYINTRHGALYFIAQIENPDLQECLAKNARENNPSIDAQSLLKRAKRVSCLIHDYQLTYDEALVISNINKDAWNELKFWFILVIPAFFRNESLLTPDIVWHITTFLTGLSVPDSQDIYNKINFTLHKQLFVNELISSSKCLKFGFFKSKRKKLLEYRSIIEKTTDNKSVLHILDGQDKEDLFYKKYLEKHHLRCSRF